MASCDLQGLAQGQVFDTKVCPGLPMTCTRPRSALRVLAGFREDCRLSGDWGQGQDALFLGREDFAQRGVGNPELFD